MSDMHWTVLADYEKILEAGYCLLEYDSVSLNLFHVGTSQDPAAHVW
jgi:hypothetical protein